MYAVRVMPVDLAVLAERASSFRMSEDNETGLQKCATPTELQTHLVPLFNSTYQKQVLKSD